MSDLISRQAAMAFPLSWEHRDKEHGSDEFISGVECYRDYVEGLPSAQQWIPCSERLPEQDQICLICGKNGGVYVARFWRNETLILWTKTGTGKFVKAVAWMPLPAPYRPEGEEHERA